MRKANFQEFLEEKIRVAETYFKHGLVVESRNIYLSLLNSAERLKEKDNRGGAAGQDAYLDSLCKDIESKLKELDAKIEDLQSSSLNIGVDELLASGETESAETLFQKAMGLKELGMNDEALSNIREALKRGYEAHSCLIEIYRCRAGRGQDVELIKELEQGLEDYEFSSSQEADLCRMLGILCEKADRRSDALEYYKRVAKSDSRFKEKLMKKIALLEKQSEKQELEKKASGGPLPQQPETITPADASQISDETKEDEEDEVALSIENAKLKKKVEELTFENGRLQSLLDEYQKRYQDIMTFSLTLQKEIRELKDKLQKVEGDSGKKSS
jgi:tetratricopeptide (TPR) repeat protein